MRTILVGDCAAENLYLLSDPDEPLEAQFQPYVIKALRCIYQQYHCVPFDGTFRYEVDRKKPDLALVARDLSHWFILEVELVSHSFEGHVLPQVKAFRYGEPEDDCATKLARALNRPLQELQTFIKFVPSTVAVIANKSERDWQNILRSHGIQMLTVSVFESSTGVMAIQVDGMLEAVEESLGFGTYSATDRSLLFPPSAKLPDGAIQLNDPAGSVSWWVVRRTAETTWVTKQVGTPDFAHGTYIQILRTVGGRLTLRRPR